MCKNIKRLFVNLFIIVGVICLSLTNIYAAGFSLGLSVKDNKNGTLSATIGGSIVGLVSVSVNGQSQNVYLESIGDTKTFEFKTGAGSFTVTAKGENISNANYEPNDKPVVETKSIVVTDKSAIKPKPEKPAKPAAPEKKPVEDTRSKDNSLASLTVDKGELSPKFSANTTQYKVSVEGTTTSIKLNATAKDSKASVSGTGEKQLQVGKNTFVIKCTAENGSTRNYTIDVYVDEKPLIYADFQDQKLGVVRNLTNVGTPLGFEKGKTQLNGQEVDAWINQTLGLTVCYLEDEKSQKDFYVIENGNISYRFQRVEIDGRNFVIVPVDEKLKNREGFVFKRVKANEVECDGWIYEDAAMKNYVQLYLMNEAGEKILYDYEISENQLQKYTEPTKEEEPFNIFIATTVAFASISFITIGYILFDKKKAK